MLANFLVTSKGLFEKGQCDPGKLGEGQSAISSLTRNYPISAATIRYRIANGNSLRLKVGERPLLRNGYLYDDTSAIKAAASRLGQQVNFSFEAKA